MSNLIWSPRRAARHAAGAMIVALVPFFAAAAEPAYRPTKAGEAPSFELWCRQIQLYPPARCDRRTSSDTEDYEHYRTLAEQFVQTRAAQEEEDRELMNRLNRDPTAKHGFEEGLP